MRRARIVWMLTVLCLSGASCNKPDVEKEPSDILTAELPPLPPPVPSTSTPTPTPTPTSTPTSTPTRAPDAGVSCGQKPLPDCPLQAWMKANAAAAMASQDMDAVATAFDKIAAFAPAGYTNWVSISKDGAAAARAASLEGVKGGCRGCHEQYKKKYVAELRTRPLL